MRPKSDEYNSYYQHYISLVPTENIIEEMQKGIDMINGICNDVTDTWGDYRYQEGKWTVKQMLQHLIDGERVFGFRAMSIARGDKGNLPGFDHDAYANTGTANHRSVEDLREEFELTRKSTIALFKSLLRDEWTTMGSANGSPVSVRAIAFIICGHVQHHVNILKERYIPALKV